MNHDTTIEKRIEQLLEEGREIFVSKLGDYGPCFLVYRPLSLADQMWIKIRRIRNIEESGVSMVGEDVRGDYIAMVNYAAMLLMREALPTWDDGSSDAVDNDELLHAYDDVMRRCIDVHRAKNHDYGAAWLEMHITSITDIIMVKLMRIMHILKRAHAPKVSEGVDGQLVDVIIWSLFGLYLYDHAKEAHSTTSYHR